MLKVSSVVNYINYDEYREYIEKEGGTWTSSMVYINWGDAISFDPTLIKKQLTVLIMEKSLVIILKEWLKKMLR